jgi:hypothetical protein
MRRPPIAKGPYREYRCCICWFTPYRRRTAAFCRAALGIYRSLGGQRDLVRSAKTGPRWSLGTHFRGLVIATCRGRRRCIGRVMARRLTVRESTTAWALRGLGVLRRGQAEGPREPLRTISELIRHPTICGVSCRLVRSARGHRRAGRHRADARRGYERYCRTN